MVPKSLKAFWTFVHAAESVNQLFSAFWDLFMPCKSAASLGIAKFYKNSAKLIVF